MEKVGHLIACMSRKIEIIAGDTRTIFKHFIREQARTQKTDFKHELGVLEKRLRFDMRHVVTESEVAMKAAVGALGDERARQVGEWEVPRGPAETLEELHVLFAKIT